MITTSYIGKDEIHKQFPSYILDSVKLKDDDPVSEIYQKDGYEVERHVGRELPQFRVGIIGPGGYLVVKSLEHHIVDHKRHESPQIGMPDA